MPDFSLFLPDFALFSTKNSCAKRVPIHTTCDSDLNLHKSSRLRASPSAAVIIYIIKALFSKIKFKLTTHLNCDTIAMEVRNMDYSQYPLSGKMYGGSEKKIGIIINDERYIVKFQKDSLTGLRFNHVSEYLGSHIFTLLGFKAQETYLGTYNNQQVVVMKDFLTIL